MSEARALTNLIGTRVATFVVSKWEDAVDERRMREHRDHKTDFGSRRTRTDELPMYDTPFQFLVLRESGIRSVAEIASKRVGVGPRGGPRPGLLQVANRFCAALGA